MSHSRITDLDGEHQLSLECGELPADQAVEDAGHEPNGYFWEGIATLLDPELAERLEPDPEADMFCTMGSLADLQRLQQLLEPVLDSPERVRELLERAEAEGFEFDD